MDLGDPRSVGTCRLEPRVVEKLGPRGVGMQDAGLLLKIAKNRSEPM